MKLRKIKRPLVEEALAKPYKVMVGSLNRRIVLKRHEYKWIKVIFEQDEEPDCDHGILDKEDQLMKVEYDGRADAMYIAFRKGRYKISEEISDDVIIDLDNDCRILGIEILGISNKIEDDLLRQIIKAEKIAYKLRT